MKIIFHFLLALISIVFTSCQVGDVKSWEYKLVYYDAEKITSEDKNYVKATTDFYSSVSSKSVIPEESGLNKMGKDGWELVSSYLENETVYPNLLARGSGVAGLQTNVRPQRLVLIFKRPNKGK